jgi:hypothetical protein
VRYVVVGAGLLARGRFVGHFTVHETTFVGPVSLSQARDADGVEPSMDLVISWPPNETYSAYSLRRVLFRSFRLVRSDYPPILRFLMRFLS